MNSMFRLCLFTLALASAVFVACGDEEARAPAEPPHTVAELYARIANALSRPDAVLYSRATTMVADAGGERPDHVTEYWIDGVNGRARTQYTLDPSVDAYDRAASATAIYEDRYAYIPDDEDEALRQEYRDRCPESDDALIALLLECGTYYGLYFPLAPPRLEDGREYDDDPALVMVQEGYGLHDRAVITAFVDPSTFLPIAETIEIIPDAGGTLQYTTAYIHEFVDPDSLEASFFDPRSIGYGPPPSWEQTLDEQGREAPVYWVGEEYTAASGDEYVLARLPDPLYGESAHLIYETPEGLVGFDILVFSPEAWDAFLRSDMGLRLTDRECVPQSTLARGEVQLFTIPWPEFPVSETPQTPEEVCDLVVAKEPELIRWGHLAVVRRDDAVVAVGDASGTPAADTALLEDVVRDLQRR
ncbi:MAG TPA: hypothetical protein VJP07_00270 [Dehalococcoidia bacterium]|nr:hypothetical protein [Dehalococcoidia bacterium]